MGDLSLILILDLGGSGIEATAYKCLYFCNIIC